MLSRRVIAYYGLMRASESLPAAYGFAAGAAAPKENGLRWESRGSPIYSAGLYSRAASHTPATRRVRLTASSSSVLPRQERSSQARNHGTTPPYGRELPPGRTRKGEVDSDSLFRVFRWIPWLISDPSGAAIGCCWTESAVRICADLGCRGNMPKTKALRDETKYRLLPPLDPDTYSGLKANIAINGVQVPIVRDEKGYILDGFARAKIAKELGYECPSVTVKGLSDQEKRSQVRALNLARRHLDYQAKRLIIADEIKENPDRSNRWIARSLGVHHATVIAVRNELSSTGHVDQLGALLGRDGKIRPAIGTITATNGKAHVPGLDEEEILRAATAIRLRRNEERSRQQFEKEEQARTKLNGKRTWTLTDDPKVVRCDLLIADPPFGITDEPWDPKDVEGFNREWSRRWAACGADFVAIFWCQPKLWEGRK